MPRPKARVRTGARQRPAKELSPARQKELKAIEESVKANPNRKPVIQPAAAKKSAVKKES